MRHMTRLATIVATIAIAVATTASSAHAGDLERQTRRDAGIPAKAIKRVPAEDTFTRGTKFRPEGTHCYVARTVRRVSVQGKRVQKNRLLRYCTDKYIDERTSGRVFARYLRTAKANPAELAEQRRLDLLREEALRKFVADCIAGGGLIGPLGICITPTTASAP